MYRTLTPGLTLTALLGFGLMASCAVAQEHASPRSRYDQKSVLVDFDDLNPAIPADARTLLARVAHGVNTACVRGNDIRHLSLADDRATCRTSGYAAAITRINRALGIDLEALAGSARSDPTGSLAVALPRQEDRR